MNIVCNRSLLMEALTTCSKAAASKSSLPVLEGIMLRTERNSLYLCCYNLEIGISKYIEAAVTEPGCVVLPLKVCDIIRKLPSDVVRISCDEKFMVRIVSGASDFGIVGLRADEFPELPTVDTKHSISLPQMLLRSIISQTSYAISSVENAPAIYKGAYFETEGEMLNIVTLDGYRLAYRHEYVGENESYNFIVPGKTLQEVSKILTDEEGRIDINVAPNNIIFTANGYTIISRLITGDYVNYRATMAGESRYTVRIKTSALLSCVERMSLVNSESYKSPVRCIFDKNTLRMTCETPIGRAEEVVECECECENFVIGFNNKYMLDAFKAADLDEIIISLNTPSTPARITPPDGDNFLFLLLPIRLSANQG